MLPAENKIKKTLAQVIDPLSKKDLVTLNAIKDLQIKENKVVVDVLLDLSTQAIKKEIQKKIEESILDNANVSVVKVNVNAKQYRSSSGSAQTTSTLNKVKSIIAISSCKEGVGKSTITAHLAIELAKRKLKVGLLDADVYGPSVPTLFNLHDVTVYTDENGKAIPPETNNIKTMSFGFLLGKAPAVMRGPIVTQYIQQLLHATQWGSLDYLLIDMPPGTGDIHLTITQSARLDGAVIISTPHALSLVDVARGIIMFEKVNVPILGVIENMAYFQANGGDEKHYVFGQASSEVLEKQFGITTIGEIPILPALGQSLTPPQGNNCIQSAADEVLKAVDKIKSEKREVPVIQFDKDNIYLMWNDGKTWTVNNRKLRLISQDALSVNEVTGEQIIKDEDIPEDIAPKEITALGNYAITVTWTDGHSSAIYPYPKIHTISTESSSSGIPKSSDK